MKIKTSWTRLIQAGNIGAQYVSVHPEKTKLEYAIQRSLIRIGKTNDTLQELLEGIDIDHAAVDDKGVLLVPYQFSPEKKKQRNAARNKLLHDENGVEIEAYFAQAVPDDLTEVELDAFGGIIISTEDVAAIRARRESQELPTAISTEGEEQPSIQ